MKLLAPGPESPPSHVQVPTPRPHLPVSLTGTRCSSLFPFIPGEALVVVVVVVVVCGGWGVVSSSSTCLRRTTMAKHEILWGGHWVHHVASF